MVMQDSLEEATRFVARLLEPVNAEHEEFEVTPGGSAVLVAIPKQHAESKRQAKQQRKASQRAEQELRVFNHGRSHSIDSGNSLISETVHMSTSSLTADTELDIGSIAESESPFSNPLPDHHSSSDGGPAWISPAGLQPAQVSHNSLTCPSVHYLSCSCMMTHCKFFKHHSAW